MNVPNPSSVFLEPNFMGPAVEVHGQVVLYGSSTRLYNQAVDSGWDAEAMAERSRLLEGLWRLRSLLQDVRAGRGWNDVVLMLPGYGMSSSSETEALIQAIDAAVQPSSDTAALRELFEKSASYLGRFTANEICEGLESAQQAIRLQRDVVAQYEIPDGAVRKILGALSLDDYMPEDGDRSRLEGFAAAIAEYEREYGDDLPGELLCDNLAIRHQVNEAIATARNALEIRPAMC